MRYSHLDQAVLAASEGEGLYRVGAVAVNRKTGFAYTCNTRKGHPKLKSNGYDTWCGMHAEFRLVMGWPMVVEGGEVYIARINKKGKVKTARPCPKCEALLKRSGVRRIIYTTESGAESYKL